MSHAAELQKSIYIRLTTDAPLITLLSGTPKVYDRIPTVHNFPYIRIGEDRLTNQTMCEGEIVFITSMVHVFSRSVGKVEVKRIADAVRKALSDYLPMTGYEIRQYKFESAVFLSEPDGLTEHAALSISYSIVEN